MVDLLHAAPPSARALRLWCLLLAGMLSAPAWAQPVPAWQLRHTDPDTGTQVWLRDRGEQLPAFRASTRVPARLSSLVALLLDRQRMPEWVYRTRSARLVYQHSPQQGVSLVVTAMPWPLADRESVVAWRLQQDTSTGVVTLSGQEAEAAGQPWWPDPAPGHVRMHAHASQWTFAPVADAPGQVDVVFEGHGNPGGSLASPLLRGFVAAAIWQGPLDTVNALRQMVQRPEYRDAVLPFIVEPTP